MPSNVVSKFLSLKKDDALKPYSRRSSKNKARNLNIEQRTTEQFRQSMLKSSENAEKHYLLSLESVFD